MARKVTRSLLRVSDREEPVKAPTWLGKHPGQVSPRFIAGDRRSKTRAAKQGLHPMNDRVFSIAVGAIMVGTERAFLNEEDVRS